MEEEYNSYREKFQLPEFDALEKEFEITSLEDDFTLLRGIRKKMAEKIEFIASTLKEVIHPETNIVSMRESSQFSDEEKMRVAELYAKLMHTLRHSLELFIDDNDDSNAKFIHTVFNDWIRQKKELLFFMRKLKDAWEKDLTEKDTTTGYFG